MATVQSILKQLHSKAQADQLDGMARYGINVDNRLGVKVPEMRKMAKEVGKDHQLAQALWETKIPDAMIIASMVAVPELVTKEQMDVWVRDFNSWDVCDLCCGALLDKTEFAYKKAFEFSKRKEEFVKRTGFVLMASLFQLV